MQDSSKCCYLIIYHVIRVHFFQHKNGSSFYDHVSLYSYHLPRAHPTFYALKAWLPLIPRKTLSDASTWFDRLGSRGALFLTCSVVFLKSANKLCYWSFYLFRNYSKHVQASRMYTHLLKGPVWHKTQSTNSKVWFTHQIGTMTVWVQLLRDVSWAFIT